MEIDNNKTKKRRGTIPSLLNTDNSLAITDNEKLNLFRKHLFEIF